MRMPSVFDFKLGVIFVAVCALVNAALYGLLTSQQVFAAEPVKKLGSLLSSSQVEESEFNRLLQEFMGAFIAENPPAVDVGTILATSIERQKSFAEFQSEIDFQELSAQFRGGSAEDVIRESDNRVADGQTIKSATALLENMFNGSILDFNRKIIVLAGVTIFDPLSARAIRYLFELMGQSKFNDSYFRNLKLAKDWRKQAADGAVYGVGAAAALSAISYLRPSNWGRAIGAFKRLLAKKPASSKYGRSQRGDDIGATPSAPNRDRGVVESRPPVKEPSANAARDMLNNIEHLENQLADLDEMFNKLGVTGAIEKAERAQAPVSAAAKSSSAPIVAHDSAASRLPIFLRRAKSATFRVFLKMDFKSQLLLLRKLMFIGGVGAAADVGFHRLWAALFPDQSTNVRLVPLDVTEDDLMTRHYDALAALALGCRAFELRELVARMSIDGDKDTQVQFLNELSQLLEQQRFLMNVSPFRDKVFVAKEIQFDDTADTIRMDLPFYEQNIHEEFSCSKYDGLGAEPLQVSVTEALYDLEAAYSKFSKIFVSSENQQSGVLQ